VLAMGLVGLGPQKPGPAHQLVGWAYQNPVWPTSPMGQSKIIILTKIFQLT